MKPLPSEWRSRLGETIATVPRAEVAELVGELARQQALLIASLATPAAPASGELLTVDAVAERLGLTTQRVYDLCRRGRLPHVRLGRQVRVAPVALEKWLAEGGEGL